MICGNSVIFRLNFSGIDVIVPLCVVGRGGDTWHCTSQQVSSSHDTSPPWKTVWSITFLANTYIMLQVEQSVKYVPFELNDCCLHISYFGLLRACVVRIWRSKFIKGCMVTWWKIFWLGMHIVRWLILWVHVMTRHVLVVCLVFVLKWFVLPWVKTF